MKVLILAAGRGTRISRYLSGKPKCTVDIGGGQCLIEYTIDLLHSRGIQDIGIVLGYEAQVIREVLADKGVSFFYNPFYDVTNSIASAWFAKEFLTGDDLLIMNGDVYLEEKLLDRILAQGRSPVMFADESRRETADYKFFYEDGILKKYGKALTWDDVDFQKGTVSISKTLKRVRRDAVDALNGKDILYQFPSVFDEGRTVTVLKRPKTKSSIRTVYLPDYVLDALQEWKETLKPVKRNRPDLILRYSNGRPLSEETLPRLLEKQLLQLGLPVVSFHSLRHSSISYKLVLTGGNIKAVQGDSGHAQAEMITERYGHIIDSCRKQCAQDFEEEFYKGM